MWFTFLHLFPGSAAIGWEAADWPAAAALPAPIHQVIHQTTGRENQGQTEWAQSQAGGPENAAKAPWQIKVCITPQNLEVQQLFKHLKHIW